MPIVILTNFQRYGIIFELNNKVAIVTGTSELLARSGVNPALLSTYKESLKELERDILELNGSVILLECDILNKESLTVVKDSILSLFERIAISLVTIIS